MRRRIWARGSGAGECEGAGQRERERERETRTFDALMRLDVTESTSGDLSTYRGPCVSYVSQFVLAYPS